MTWYVVRESVLDCETYDVLSFETQAAAEGNARYNRNVHGIVSRVVEADERPNPHEVFG